MWTPPDTRVELKFKNDDAARREAKNFHVFLMKISSPAKIKSVDAAVCGKKREN